jgi:adenosylhomocysteinase
MADYRVADINLAPEGQKKIDWAWQSMPVLKHMESKYTKNQPFKGAVIAACLHLEAKTACLLLLLRRLGALVSACGSNPLSTQDDVCAALAKGGVHVFSHRGMNSDSYSNYIRDALKYKPNVIIDDGADVVALIHSERKDLIPGILGGSEETTTGVKRIKAMVEHGILMFPMISVNDAHSKYLFDNRYGTGQSVWDGIVRTTNSVIAGKKVVIAGYGWCGKGVAKRASGLGARVIVTEIDPHRAAEALMDGFDVMNMNTAASIGDIFITVTGNTKVIREEHYAKMKDGVILGNAGHFDIEVWKPDLEAMTDHMEYLKPNIQTYVLKDGRRINLLGEGRLTNLACADGHPIEIMDLSFALQLESALRIFKGEKMKPALYNVPAETDKSVMIAMLESWEISLEKLTVEQEEYLKTWQEK